MRYLVGVEKGPRSFGAYVPDLPDLVKDFAESRQRQRQSLMPKLRNITIDAPEDYSTNFDLYLTGEKVQD